MEKIKKSDVLKGLGKRVEVETTDGLVVIRPLSDAEMEQVETLVYEGLSRETIDAMPKIAKAAKKALKEGKELEVLEKVGISAEDMMQFKKNESASTRQAVAFAMSCDGEEWTADEVGRLSRGVPALIAKEVFEISGTGVTVEQARRFCEKRGGGSDSAK